MRLILICFCLSLFMSCHKNESHVHIQKTINYSLSDNISNQHITAIAEDALGYIWLGTLRGLNRYNGYDYYQYYKDTNNHLSISGNEISSILKDSQNRLWISTDNKDGICRLDEKSGFQTISIRDKSYSPVQIIETANKEIIINQLSHLSRYDSINNQFKQFYQFEQFNKFNKCYIDKHNHLWIITSRFIQCLNYTSLEPISTFEMNPDVNIFHSYLIGDLLFVLQATAGLGSLEIIDVNKIEHLTVPKAIKRHPVLSKALITIVHPYEDDKLIINTHKNGIYIYNSKKDVVIHQTDKNFPFDVPDDEITTFFTDSQNNLWIGTFSQGFKVIYKYNQQFNNNIALHHLTDGQSVTALACDNDNLWIATLSNNLYIYNLHTNDIKYIDITTFFPEDPYFQDKICSIYIGKEDVVWLQSESKLTQCKYKDKKLFKIKTFNFFQVIQGIAEDSIGTVWTGSQNNCLYAIQKNADKYKKLAVYPANYKYYKECLLTLSSGKVLVAASGQYLNVIDPDNWTVVYYSMEDVIKKEDFVPTALYEDSDKNIWVGVLNLGLYKFSPDTKTTTKTGQIPCKDISSIIEDSNKYLWIGTLYGLSKYDPKQRRFFSFYAYDGIGGNQFNPSSVVKLPDGNLVFGGTHGLTIFDPLTVSIERPVPLYFEEIKSSHFSITDIDNKINLRYNENDFNISYIALDYSKYSRARYYYMMEGFDDHWIDARNIRSASYSNLPPGNYTFRVYVTNNDNPSVLAEKSLDIHISPSPWLNTWAFVVYGILILCLIAYINTLYLRVRRNREKALIAFREKEHEHYINEMNMSFFSNISHEFRTPLTMIAGPIFTLSKDESLSETNKHLLKVVNRSVNRMLRLINQILSFNKLENDALSLELKYVDVVHEINEVIEVFSINDNIKNLKINSFGLHESFFMLADKDKVEKILANMLSNAFRYSPNGGTINIRFDVVSRAEVSEAFPLTEDDRANEYIRIMVEDEGPGIPEDKLENIFQRYYQVEHGSSNGIYNWGTGIGLYFARRLAVLHHGYIKAGNRKEKGAVFAVILPVEKSPVNQSNIETAVTASSMQHSSINTGEFVNILSQPDKQKYTILVVDDDAEISAYIYTLLGVYYNVINKYDGNSAYVAIEDVKPDLVLSDVIMPGISGYELCRKIKENKDYCHIPVILLTAKSSMAEQIEGLETGANAYIPKPFDPAYLLAVIKSQLLNMENIRSLLNNSTRLPKTGNVLSENDSKFMKELYELMEKELSNSELNIHKMSKEMGMSRTKFYHKVKGLTGENPNTFFRKYKLNRAAELIKTGNYNISEIADMTGFSTLSHFSVSFKKQFGISPKNLK